MDLFTGYSGCHLHSNVYIHGWLMLFLRARASFSFSRCFLFAISALDRVREEIQCRSRSQSPRAMGHTDTAEGLKLCATLRGLSLPTGCMFMIGYGFVAGVVVVGVVCVCLHNQASSHFQPCLEFIYMYLHKYLFPIFFSNQPETAKAPAVLSHYPRPRTRHRRTAAAAAAAAAALRSTY